jgi:D-alanine--poly(phosphoribitol) ligase subunit 1
MMLQWIRQRCLEFPERPAFFIQETLYSYRAFADTISAIRMLLEREFPSEQNIGILAYDDIETYGAIFAVWFAGKTMVPITPSNPPDRNGKIIEQAGVRVVLSSRNVADRELGASDKSVNIAFTGSIAPTETTLELPREHANDDIAYILFTSGSTGAPKGVPISYGALQAFLNAFMTCYSDLGEGDRFLQMFELTFDLSLMCYCAPLTLGACVYTVPADVIKQMYIYRLLDECELTFALMVPSTLAYLRPYFGEMRLEKLRYSLFCGEALHDDMIVEWIECVPNARVYNVYGPTEATIFCLAYECRRAEQHKTSAGVVSIGKPMQDTETILVDDDLKLVDAGQTGELCLAGPQLTPGYWNNIEMNRQAFFTYAGNVYYRTGDLCSQDRDGDLMYLGRIDHQVKIQGFRVELREVEYHVREVTGVKHLAAIACPDVTGSLTIQLFLEGFQGDVRALTERLKSRLPSYMIPTKTIAIEAMPLNVNGKIDRPALLRRALAKH